MRLILGGLMAGKHEQPRLWNSYSPMIKRPSMRRRCRHGGGLDVDRRLRERCADREAQPLGARRGRDRPMPDRGDTQAAFHRGTHHGHGRTGPFLLARRGNRHGRPGQLRPCIPVPDQDDEPVRRRPQAGHKGERVEPDAEGLGGDEAPAGPGALASACTRRNFGRAPAARRAGPSSRPERRCRQGRRSPRPRTRPRTRTRPRAPRWSASQPDRRACR